MGTRFEPVRIGVVGLGGFGALHARTLEGLAEAELVGVVDPRPDRLEPWARVRSWNRIEQALTESDAEAWVVATSTGSHVPVAGMILEAGRAVLVEKPLAATRREAESLKPLVRADSSNLMVGHILLFNSEVARLRDEVQQRGPIRFINSVRHRPITTLDAYPGESPLTLLLVHDLYVALALVRGREPLSFACRAGRTDRGVDLIVAELRWSDDCLGSFTASFLTPEGMAPDGFDRLEVFGDGWAARIDPNPRPLQVWDDRARWPMALEIRAGSGAPSGMLAEELRCFCRVVRGREAVPSGASYDDALRILAWIDHLAREGR
ncbi:MAG: Gfo/Idh/MocA family oxidoreductase [Isosphaeraceae bacterium]